MMRVLSFVPFATTAPFRGNLSALERFAGNSRQLQSTKPLRSSSLLPERMVAMLMRSRRGRARERLGGRTIATVV